MAGGSVIDIPSQNICENILAYEPIGRKDTLFTHTWAQSPAAFIHTGTRTLLLFCPSSRCLLRFLSVRLSIVIETTLWCGGNNQEVLVLGI